MEWFCAARFSESRTSRASTLQQSPRAALVCTRNRTYRTSTAPELLISKVDSGVAFDRGGERLDTEGMSTKDKDWDGDETLVCLSDIHMCMWVRARDGELSVLFRKFACFVFGIL